MKLSERSMKDKDADLVMGQEAPGWANGNVSLMRKKRTLKQLSKSEKIEIADAYSNGYEHRKDIAVRFRVSEPVVSRIVAMNPSS